MSLDIVTGIFIVFLVSSVLLYFFGKFKIPSIVSLIVTGIVLGKIGILKENYLFEEISNLGMMLLLFFIGVEFSFRILLKYRKEAIFGGLGQIFFTLLPVFLLSLVFFDYKVAFIISVVVTMSSTAVIAGIVEYKGSLNVTYGRISFLISLVQDVIGILVLAFLPFITGSKVFDTKVLIGILVFTVYVVALFYFTKTKFSEALALRDRYLLVFLAIVLSFGSGVVSRLCGLSHLLGAFIAGIIVSETLFGRQIASEILPIKEIFVGFFFVYVGTLLDINLFISNLTTILYVTFAILVFKFVVSFLVLFFMKVSLENNIRSSVLITSIGEYGLLILSVGLADKILSDKMFVILSSSLLFSMVTIPLIFELLDNIESKFSFLRTKGIEDKKLKKFDVIVVGFGPVGKKLVDFLESSSISYVVLEMNPETVKKYEKNYNIRFGDAKKENILKWAGVESSKLIVITPPILREALFISEKAKSINPNVNIIARVKFLSEVDKLVEIGVDVVCDEVEVSDFIIQSVVDKLSLTKV